MVGIWREAKPRCGAPLRRGRTVGRRSLWPVTSASIVLKGRIFPAHWEHTRRALDADLTLLYGPRGDSEKYRTHPDALDDILEQELYFLPIFPPVSLPSVPSDQAEIVNELFATMGIILNRVPTPLSADQSLEYLRRVGVLRLSRDKSREVLAEFQVLNEKVITIF